MSKKKNYTLDVWKKLQGYILLEECLLVLRYHLTPVCYSALPNDIGWQIAQDWGLTAVLRAYLNVKRPCEHHIKNYLRYTIVNGKL